MAKIAAGSQEVSVYIPRFTFTAAISASEAAFTLSSTADILLDWLIWCFYT